MPYGMNSTAKDSKIPTEYHKWCAVGIFYTKLLKK